MSTSIIIPVFNDVDGLQITLTSIMQYLSDRKDIEIIICNDGGGESISKIAIVFGVHEVRLEKNKGSYAARNKGIMASKGDYLVFLDANQRISRQWLISGLSSLKDNDYVGGNIIIESGAEPSSWELLDVMTAFPVERYLRDLHFAPTANLFVSKHVFDHVGLFNEFLNSGGDREFGVRVYEAGFKQGYNPEAMTYHPARNKSEQILKQKRIGRGVVELHCVIWKENPLIFLLISLRNLFQIPIETAYRCLRYFLADGRKKENFSLQFIIMKKFLKMILWGHIVRRAFGIIITKR